MLRRILLSEKLPKLKAPWLKGTRWRILEVLLVLINGIVNQSSIDVSNLFDNLKLAENTAAYKEAPVDNAAEEIQEKKKKSNKRKNRGLKKKLKRQSAQD
jgi:hypothetical protein